MYYSDVTIADIHDLENLEIKSKFTFFKVDQIFTQN